LQAVDQLGATVTKPIVARIDGNNAIEGRKILNDANHEFIELVDTMDAAARRVAELAAARKEA
jgi:succinyl-CoA synthetase beta subunit